jgi:hypothetical protein
MKHFTEYLMEIRPLYEFVIRIAGCDLDADGKQRIESALSMYVVENISAARRLPIQEHADFAGMGPCEVHMIDVTVKYPTITEQIRTTVAQALNLPLRSVCVRTRLEEQQREPMAAPKKAKDGSVLTEPNLESESAQDLVGSRRTESMLKQLQTRQYEFAEKMEKARDTLMPQGTLSPVGSTRNKIPSPRKGK